MGNERGSEADGALDGEVVDMLLSWRAPGRTGTLLGANRLARWILANAGL